MNTDPAIIATLNAVEQFAQDHPEVLFRGIYKNIQAIRNRSPSEDQVEICMYDGGDYLVIQVIPPFTQEPDMYDPNHPDAILVDEVGNQLIDILPFYPQHDNFIYGNIRVFGIKLGEYDDLSDDE